MAEKYIDYWIQANHKPGTYYSMRHFNENPQRSYYEEMKAARIKVSFAEQEATLKLQKAQLEEEEKKAAASADRQKADLEIKATAFARS